MYIRRANWLHLSVKNWILFRKITYVGKKYYWVLYKHWRSLYLLLGNQITIHINHDNLIFHDTKHTYTFVLHQKLLLEEYSCGIQNTNGSKNIMADTLSCLGTNLVEEIACDSHFGTVHLPQKYEHTSVGHLFYITVPWKSATSRGQLAKWISYNWCFTSRANKPSS